MASDHQKNQNAKMSSNFDSTVSSALELFDIKYQPTYALDDLSQYDREFYDKHSPQEISNDFTVFVHAQSGSDKKPLVLVDPNAVIPSSFAGAGTQQKTEPATANDSVLSVQKNGYFSEINFIKSEFNGQSEDYKAPTVKQELDVQNEMDRQLNEFVFENDIDLDRLFDSSSFNLMMESETSEFRLVPSSHAASVHSSNAISNAYRADTQQTFAWPTLPQPEPYSRVPAPATCLPLSTSPTSTLSTSSSSSVSSSSSSSFSSSTTKTSKKDCKKQKRRCYELSGSASAAHRKTPSGLTKADFVKQEPRPPIYPKPAYSYSCLITLALKNSPTGKLRVSEIYSFLCKHFPYFKTAPNGWKNSVRHNLSLNKCFEKIEKTTNGSQAKGCHWTINHEKITKMEEEMLKSSRKDPNAIRIALQNPEDMEALENGEFKHNFTVSSSSRTASQSEESNFDSADDNFDEFLAAVPATAPSALQNLVPLRIVNNGQTFVTRPTKSITVAKVASNGVQTYVPIKQEYVYDELDSNIIFSHHQ